MGGHLWGEGGSETREEEAERQGCPSLSLLSVPRFLSNPVLWLLFHLLTTPGSLLPYTVSCEGQMLLRQDEVGMDKDTQHVPVSVPMAEGTAGGSLGFLIQATCDESIHHTGMLLHIPQFSQRVSQDGRTDILRCPGPWPVPGPGVQDLCSRLLTHHTQCLPGFIALLGMHTVRDPGPFSRQQFQE